MLARYGTWTLQYAVSDTAVRQYGDTAIRLDLALSNLSRYTHLYNKIQTVSYSREGKKMALGIGIFIIEKFEGKLNRASDSTGRIGNPMWDNNRRYTAS